MTVSPQERGGTPTAATRVPHPDAIEPCPGADGPRDVDAAVVASRPSRQWELDALRVLAIAGVVAIHVVGLLVANDDWKGTTRWWAAVAIDLGSVWVVPVFVMISGALLLSPRAHAAGPAAFYRKRFVRVLPALVVWHLVYLFGVRVGLRDENLDLRLVATWLVDAKVYTALYFLWLIAGLYVVAPVLAAFLQAGGQHRAMATAAVAMSWTLLAFVIAGVATLVGSPRPIHLGAWNQWWPYVGYFVAGWALRRVVLSLRGTVIASVLALAMLAEIVWQYGNRPEPRTLQLLVSTGYLGVPTAVAAVCIFLVAVGVGARWVPGARVTRGLVRLSDASFGVFLVHLLILEIVRQTVPAVAAASSLWVLLAAYGVVLVSSFAVSLVAARVPILRAVF